MSLCKKSVADVAVSGKKVLLRCDFNVPLQNGAIAFVESPCPDHLCEGFGWLSRAGDWAACLPAEASVTIEDGG